MAYDKLTEPPKTVKEAIDWLIRIGDMDKSQSNGGQPNSANCNALEKAIQKLTGSTRSLQSVIQTLISDLSKFIGYKNGQINGSGIIKNGSNGNYTSAYDSSNATWPSCGPAGACSGCQGNSTCNCSASSSKSCDGTCCHRCDIRICAGIFVALVPALETALRELRDKCNESNNRQQNITSEGLKGYFTALGYEENQLNNALNGTTASSKLTNATSKLRDIKGKIESAFNSKQRTSNQNGFTATEKSISTSNGSSTPTSIREMLLWLMGLPYCEGYGEFVKKLKTDNYKNILGPTRTSSGTNYNPLAKQLSAVIFQLPTVFYSVEGHISYLKEVFDQFKNGGQLKFNYPTTNSGTDMLNTLSAYVAVCYPILKYLMQRCDVVGSGRSRRLARAAQGTTTTAEENDGAWGDLLVSGQENSSPQGPQTKSSTPTPSTVPQTALKDFLVFMGFQTGSGTVTGDDLYENALKDCFSDTMKTDDEDEEKAVAKVRSATSKDQKLPALRKLAKHVLQGLYGPATGGASGGGSSPNGTTPTTIRQMMLWLIGLPLTTAYKGSSGTTQAGTAASASLFGDNGPVVTGINQNNALKDLEKGPGRVTRGHSTPTAATGKHFKQQLKDSIVGMIMLFQRIEGGLGSVVNFLKDGFKDKNGGSSGAAQGNGKFKYDGKTILNVFSSYVYKVHTQLRFLKVMCTVGKGLGGWNHCIYGGSNQIKNDVTGIRCQCSGTKYTGECHHPLQHFLTDDDKEKSLENRFKHGSNLVIMGFSSERLPSQRTEGSHIHTYLEQLLDPIPTTATQPSPSPTPSQPTSKPLSLLTQYCVAIGKMDPLSLGDHFDVFRELAGDMWNKIEAKVKGEIKGITKDDESGQGASGRLQQALQAVWPTGHNGQHDGDLASLTGCNGSAPNCTPFVASLSHGLYKYFDPTKLPSVQYGVAINWLYMKMSALYGKLVTLKTEMESKCQCCPEGDPNPQPSCAGITNCPSCLPLLYKMGLVFGDPKQLTSKKCSDLMDMMESVLVTTTSKLCVVFKTIDDKRFWPYLLFASSVVDSKNGQLNGDAYMKSYTVALGDAMYDAYLKDKKEQDKTKAKENKKARDEALKCTCVTQHTYAAPQTKQVTPTTVTLTLYFKSANITEVVTITVPHHGPLYNPLVRLYPRNLKSIVDWLLRIGQTRLEQGDEKKGVEEMCKTFWPNIRNQLNAQDQKMFKDLVEKVTTMMGLENKGNKEVGEEVKKELEDVKDKIQKKLKNGNGEEGFNNTFTSILEFKPDQYLNEVIKDFGQKVYDVNKGSVSKRSFECVAKAVSKCMKDSLDKIKNLAQTNKELESKYGVDVPELTESIQEVSELQNISTLQTLCEGFQKFHTAYTTVSGAFGTNLTTAQKNGASTEWQKINKCVEAFKEWGGCVNDLEALKGYGDVSKMQEASGKLNELSQKLNTVIDNLKDGDDLSTFSQQVDEFIGKLDEEHLKKEGEKKLETALEIYNSKTTSFDKLLNYYVSELITKMKKNNNDKNTSCDIHLRVRNDLQQLSECLKVMCEVCGTGMKDFAKELKECVTVAKGHLDGIDKVKGQLNELKTKLTSINNANSHSEMTQLSDCITTIHLLLKDPYIYNPPPLLSEQIKNASTMTHYLKSLPNLIRDRYVLQKWKDSPEHFCGVQEFKGGIVKPSDIKGIDDKLQNLLKDTFHTGTEFPITIHEFQVRALIYNFCHKEGIRGIDSGIKVMRYLGFSVIKNDVEWNKVNKTDLKRVVDDICGNSYLRYFAGHLRDSVGYHTLSNTLGALDKVKEKLGENNGEPEKWSEISKLLKKTVIDQLHERLQGLVDKLNREYIFEYPPFDWQKSCKRLVEQNNARTKRSTDASPAPSSTTCEMCVPSMAHIFIGFVPQMYRLFKMLREIAQKEKQSKSDTLLNADNVQDILTKTLTVAGFFECEGWRLKLGSGTSVPELGYDLDENKTGTEVCQLLEAIIGNTPTGDLLAQRENNVSTTDSSLKSLESLFKAVMQHFRTKRDEKKTEREKRLKQEFETEQQRTKSGLTFLAPLPALPSTVRQVLFWLHELDTNKVFYDAMSQHINTLCKQSSIQIYDGVITHLLKLSATQALEVLATIEDPGRQNPQYYYELYTEEHYYAYPTVNVPLFFYTFVEKLMAAFLELNFVCVQCEFTGKQGGWKDCHIGKSEHSMKGQNCRCTKSHTKASAFIPVTVSGSVVCPRPLYSFLFDNKTDLRIPGDVSHRLPYMSKGTIPCGFQLKNKAITDAATQGDAQSAHTPTPAPNSVTGSVLVEPLRKLVGGHVTGRHTNTTTRNGFNTLSTVIYLRDLLRYVLCLAVRPPWSMSENMAFFYRVTESWKKQGGGTGTVALPNKDLLGAIHEQISLFPGSFNAELLTTAVERFAGIEDKEQHDKANGAASPSGHHQFDLQTLMGCQRTNTGPVTAATAHCSPFIFPLALDVYTHYDHKNSRAYLSWILNFAFGIYGQLRGLEEMIKGSACVVKNTSSSMSDCASLPMCPGVLTALYQSGSSFMDQKQLAKKGNNKQSGTNTTKKTCAQFHTVLTGLFNCNIDYCTPLHNLIVQCEAFLWSIRLPFSLVQLSLWSVAILFISYVFVVPLDHFKIKSHLFNRLKYTMHPSLLIADKQRRLSEVAYFSL